MDDHGREVATLVERGWDLDVATVRRRTGGLDPNASTYDLTTGDGTRYFVKRRRVPAAVTVPRYLRRHGITAVIAPLDTRDGQPFLSAGGQQVLLYPFVAGADCWATGFTDDQYVSYGRILASIHAAGAPAGVEPETFDPPSIGVLRSLVASLGDKSTVSVGRIPAEGELADLWRAHERHINVFLDRAEKLRDEAAHGPPERVLCHADIHTGNVLARPDGQLSIVDWDAPVLAPRERDLVFVLAGPWGEQPVTQNRKALFHKGYGRYEVHRPTLHYYYVERIVDDIGQFALSVLDPATDEERRRTDLYWLRRNLRDAPAHLP